MTDQQKLDNLTFLLKAYEPRPEVTDHRVAPLQAKLDAFSQELKVLRNDFSFFRGLGSDEKNNPTPLSTASVVGGTMSLVGVSMCQGLTSPHIPRAVSTVSHAHVITALDACTGVAAVLIGAALPPVVKNLIPFLWKRRCIKSERAEVEKSLRDVDQQLDQDFEKQLRTKAAVVHALFSHPHSVNMEMKNVGEQLEIILPKPRLTGNHFLVDSALPLDREGHLSVVVPLAIQTALSQVYRDHYASPEQLRILALEENVREGKLQLERPSSTDVLIADGHRRFPNAQPVTHSNPDPTPTPASTSRPRVMEHE